MGGLLGFIHYWSQTAASIFSSQITEWSDRPDTNLNMNNILNLRKQIITNWHQCCFVISLWTCPSDRTKTGFWVTVAAHLQVFLILKKQYSPRWQDETSNRKGCVYLYYCTGTQFEMIRLYLTSFFKYLHSLNYTLMTNLWNVKGAMRSTSVNPEVTLAMILMQGIKCYFRFPHYTRGWCRSVMFLITTKYQITVTHMNSVKPKRLSASPSDRLTGV